MDDAARQYVYRNVAIEIAPGRYARETWVREVWFERDATDGARSSEGKLSTAPQSSKHRKEPGPAPMFKPEDMPPERGFYQLLRTEALPVGNRFFVIARCTGGHCEGRERRIAATEWMRARAVTGCTRCIAITRAAGRKAMREANKAAGKPIYNMRGRMVS